MITTVTSATITMTNLEAIRMSVSLGAAAVVGLIAFLIIKELVDVDGRPRLKALGKHLLVSITPLLLVFGLIVMMKVTEILS
jgi:hypothetical protein